MEGRKEKKDGRKKEMKGERREGRRERRKEERGKGRSGGGGWKQCTQQMGVQEARFKPLSPSLPNRALGAGRAR